MEDEFQDINDNLGVMLYIMMGRVYDMLVVLAEAQGAGETAARLVELHSNGQLMCPLPALSMDDNK